MRGLGSAAPGGGYQDQYLVSSPDLDIATSAYVGAIGGLQAQIFWFQASH